MNRRLAALAVILLVALTSALVTERAMTPSDGSVVQLSNQPWQVGRIRIDAVLADRGLRAGDVVTHIDPTASVYTVERDGQIFAVPVRLAAFPLREFAVTHLASCFTIFVLLGVALLVFARRPHDRAAQVLLLTAALFGCGTTGWLLGADPTALALGGPTVLQTLGEAALAMVWAAILHFALILPGSRLRPSRTVITMVYALPLLLHAAYLTVALPTAVTGGEVWGRVAQLSLAPSTALPTVTAVLIAVSYRSISNKAARTRTRWVLIPFCCAVAGWVGIWLIPRLLGLRVPPSGLLPLIFLPTVLGLGAAVLRYGWFDVELILRRSLLYGGLTGFALLILLCTTWAFSRITGPRPGLGVLLTGGLVALSAQSLRRWLQRRIGRLIYGERDDPYEVMARLDQIDAAAHPTQVLQDLTDTLAQTLRLRYVAIDLGVIRASRGYPLGGATIRELTNGAEVLGQLVLEVGPGRERFGPADGKLLDALIRQISDTMSAVLLSVRLQAAREQLVLAREEERRRLHHRLHDGLGPSLAAIVLQLEVAKAQVDTSPDDAGATLARLAGTIDELGDETRRLVYDLRPSALDQLGLAAAIRDRIHTPGTQLHVHTVGDLATLPAAVEVAAYWIAVEAAHNAVRHAAAKHCRIRIAREENLTVEVTDDGRGLPARFRPGGGFLSMRDRAEEVGGRWSATTMPGGGTRIRTVLPCPAEQSQTPPGSEVPSDRNVPATP